MAITLIGYYCFNDNDTATVRDFSVQGRNSSTVTDLTISTDPGAVGKVGVFNGTSAYVNLGDVAAFDSLTAFSIVCKFKTDAIGNRQCLSSRVDHHIFEIMASGVLKITLYGAFTQSVQLNSNVLVANRWYTVVMTWNGTTGYIYLDNVDTFHYDALSDTLNNNANSIYIGWATPDIYFDGMVEMISYYNRAFDAQEIESVLESASGLKYEIADAKIQTGDLMLTNSGGREICIWSEEYHERLFSDSEDHQWPDGTAAIWPN